MKYLVVLCDGMGDLPIPALGGRTAMEAAVKPHIDRLARSAEVGLCDTSNGRKPGSDVANMMVLGYDPRVYHTGRSPLEAASIGVPMTERDVTLRCNLVTLSEEPDYEARTMIDYSAGEISTGEAARLIEVLQSELGTDARAFYAGVSYRHCLLLRGRRADGSRPNLGTTPPHDISLQKIAAHLPADPELLLLQKESARILADHEVNRARRAAGKRPANSAWFWGEGTKPQLADFAEKYGVRGCMITAVDLLRGIGVLAGLTNIDVPGATGNIDTNYRGKGEAAIRAFRDGADFVYIHIEAPDECGHRGEPEAKAAAIGDIDRYIVGPVADYLAASGEAHKILVMPDHYTPVSARTHTAEPVPYMIYDSRRPGQGVSSFTEAAAAATGRFVTVGYTLMDRFIKE